MTISEARDCGGGDGGEELEREGECGYLPTQKSEQYENCKTIKCQVTHSDIHHNTVQSLRVITVCAISF